MTNPKYNINRRRFISQASCAAIGSTTLFNTLLNLKAMNAAAIANSSTLISGNYKALVCLTLGGGNDSFNMLIPTETNAYTDYANSRSNLAIDSAAVLPLNGVNLGLHPELTDVQNLFNDNKVAFISNIGTLIEPTTKTEFYNDTVDIPLGLYSHADQFQQWQTSVPHDRVNIGWGGKVADLIDSMNNNDNISMNVSLNGANIFQRGIDTVEYSVHPYDGSIGILGFDDPNDLQLAKKIASDNMIEASYADAFKQTYVDVIKVSRDAHIEFSDAIDNVAPFSTVTFSDNDLSQSFNMVAKTIAARDTLSFQRQIFFIELNGFDMHDELLVAHSDAMRMVNDALHEFTLAMEELNIDDCVTTFTMSEFSRTLTSNGNGTDHAWGANVLVMGGGVNGGSIYGTYPSLALDGPAEVGGGVLIPDISTDEYFAELALWFGVDATDLSTIFPNIGNFFDTNSGVMPYGFLNL